MSFTVVKLQKRNQQSKVEYKKLWINGVFELKFINLLSLVTSVACGSHFHKWYVVYHSGFYQPSHQVVSPN